MKRSEIRSRLIPEKELNGRVIEVTLVLAIEACHGYRHHACQYHEGRHDNRQQGGINHHQHPGQYQYPVFVALYTGYGSRCTKNQVAGWTDDGQAQLTPVPPSPQ